MVLMPFVVGKRGRWSVPEKQTQRATAQPELQRPLVSRIVQCRITAKDRRESQTDKDRRNKQGTINNEKQFGMCAKDRGRQGERQRGRDGRGGGGSVERDGLPTFSTNPQYTHSPLPSTVPGT